MSSAKIGLKLFYCEFVGVTYGF